MKSNPIGRKELLELVTLARDRQRAYVDASAGNTNPQVIELADLAKGRADAFDAVLRALEYRERYPLRVFGAGHIGVTGDLA